MYFLVVNFSSKVYGKKYANLYTNTRIKIYNKIHCKNVWQIYRKLYIKIYDNVIKNDYLFKSMPSYE